MSECFLNICALSVSFRVVDGRWSSSFDFPSSTIAYLILSIATGSATEPLIDDSELWPLTPRIICTHGTYQARSILW